MRLIDADALLEEMRVSGKAAHMIVQEAPTIDPDSLRPTGKWKYSHTSTASGGYLAVVVCTNCGHENYAIAAYIQSGNYCPYCGAKMEG